MAHPLVEQWRTASSSSGVGWLGRVRRMRKRALTRRTASGGTTVVPSLSARLVCGAPPPPTLAGT